jgi:hypothetical protein
VAPAILVSEMVMLTSDVAIAVADPNVGWKTWIWFTVFNAIAGPFGRPLFPLPFKISLPSPSILFHFDSSTR